MDGCTPAKMSNPPYEKMPSNDSFSHSATVFHKVNDEIPSHTGRPPIKHTAKTQKPRGRPAMFPKQIVDSNDLLIRRPGIRPTTNTSNSGYSTMNNDLLPRRMGRPPQNNKPIGTSNENSKATARPRGRPLKYPMQPSTTETTNLECNHSFRQSCKRKSERLKEKTKMVMHKSLCKQPVSDTSLDNGHMPQRDSFVGISNDYIDLGDPVFECELCHALLWNAERMVGNTHSTTQSYSLCCSRGKIKLGNEVENPPKLLMDLINGDHPKSSMFIENIRRYNSMFAFTSIGAKQDMSVTDRRGPYCYRIQGENYHIMGTLLPEHGEPPKFAQQYIYDPENEIQHRINGVSKETSASSKNNGIDHQLTVELHDMLDCINPLVCQFRMAGERFVNEHEANKYKLRIIGTRERDGREYNLPTAIEVTALIVGDFDSTTNKRDIILHMQEGGLKRISELLSCTPVPIVVPIC